MTMTRWLVLWVAPFWGSFLGTNRKKYHSYILYKQENNEYTLVLNKRSAYLAVKCNRSEVSSDSVCFYSIMMYFLFHVAGMALFITHY